MSVLPLDKVFRCTYIFKRTFLQYREEKRKFTTNLLLEELFIEEQNFSFYPEIMASCFEKFI